MFRTTLRTLAPAFRQVATNYRSAALRLPSPQNNLFKSFSSSSLRFASAGLRDTDLAHVLNKEHEFETSEGDNELSSELQEIISKIPFKVVETPGEDEVKLIRTFGNEKVEITFSVKDVDVSPPEGEEGEVEEEIPNPPIHATIDITKAGNGTLTFSTIIEDGYFNIDLVTYYKDEKLAVEDSSEADWKRNALYGGPVFHDLDEDLQINFEKYLEERGVATDLALFIPSYIQYKEQKEYVNWLSSVHNFVKA